ncbi:hypothetical protein Pst134EA_013559 [Puccinia striiformis f. sp. tritici]|uniref:hypothetical protein n=1 Tax=Puccinia striiformis f. sp. tritici TaxID=168172 RepID=UPI0020085CBA|nr:hypothetical protein Pst134EA_013559 [Puccinia striiformis f. sp. tritici]KAH9454469.1 hypothetical protein Pst134EB_014551 [Puccinia striiformis f. sp. tritici]KAH9465679.1 hypothetical protein Pst134EA_013559 [Puccinia striiformis f. sp. tritici]
MLVNPNNHTVIQSGHRSQSIGASLVGCIPKLDTELDHLKQKINCTHNNNRHARCYGHGTAPDELGPHRITKKLRKISKRRCRRRLKLQLKISLFTQLASECGEALMYGVCN